MKSRFIKIMLIFAAALVAAFVILLLIMNGNPDETRRDQVVMLNGISNMIEDGDIEAAQIEIDELSYQLRNGNTTVSQVGWICIFAGISLVFIIVIFIYIYRSLIRPFAKMEAFADQVAGGDLDMPLELTRGSYFGKFTWAFDSMRREILRSRANEKESIENNKTIIATLSHDIKTPLSSLRVYTEALEANMDTSPEKRLKYISVIQHKCDQVTKLTDDLFLHALSDLEMLSIEPENFMLCEYFAEAVKDLSAQPGEIRFMPPDRDIIVSADKKRLLQIAENLINNARKYAKTPVEISIRQDEDMAEIMFRDFGHGIPDADMPFIFGKFYRGKNVGDETGSGLGLYIVKYLTEKMGGKISAENNNGLCIKIFLPVVIS